MRRTSRTPRHLSPQPAHTHISAWTSSSPSGNGGASNQMNLRHEGLKIWTRGFGCIPHVPGVATVVRWLVAEREWERIRAEASADIYATVQDFVRKGLLSDALK